MCIFILPGVNVAKRLPCTHEKSISCRITSLVGLWLGIIPIFALKTRGLLIKEALTNNFIPLWSGAFQVVLFTLLYSTLIYIKKYIYICLFKPRECVTVRFLLLPSWDNTGPAPFLLKALERIWSGSKPVPESPDIEGEGCLHLHKCKKLLPLTLLQSSRTSGVSLNSLYPQYQVAGGIAEFFFFCFLLPGFVLDFFSHTCVAHLKKKPFSCTFSHSVSQIWISHDAVQRFKCCFCVF